MTALERLRYGLDMTATLGRRNIFVDAEVATALLDLADSFDRWRDVKCPPGCVGHNHVEDCAGHAAMDDMLAASNKLRGMER